MIHKLSLHETARQSLFYVVDMALLPKVVENETIHEVVVTTKFKYSSPPTPFTL